MHMYINMYIIYIYISIFIYLFIYMCVYSPWGQLVNPQFSLPRPLFLMPSDPRRLEDIQQQPKAPRAHWMARRSICGQKPVGHHYYVCIYIYVSYSIYYIPMDPNTVWEGTWPQKIIPQVLPKEALSVHLVRPPFSCRPQRRLENMASFWDTNPPNRFKWLGLLGSIEFYL